MSKFKEADHDSAFLWQNVCFLIICKLQFLFLLFSTTGNFVCMCAELKAFELSQQIFYL